jgi:5,10-methylenetetrahydromethanopterin reductase
MRLAGRLADIVWVCFGIQEHEISLAKQYLEEGAREAGRSLEDIDLWWMVQLNIADSRSQAVEAIKANLATSGHIIFRYGLEGKAVPPEYQAQAQELAKRYQPTRHFDNISLTDDLGLTDYLADRLAIVGTVDDCINRIKELDGFGANQLFFYTALPDKERLLNHIAKDVIPAVGASNH